MGEARWTFFASLPHYAAHLAPIWLALDDDERSTFFAGPLARAELLRWGIESRWGAPKRGTSHVVVASQSNAKHYRHVALVEHGAGQSYDVVDPAYSGGQQRDMVAVFLCPNDVVARRNRAAYRDAAVEVVGSARLDALKSRAVAGGDVSGRSVALSFHWPCSLSAEAGWALEDYRAALPSVVERYSCVGHGHPRFRGFFGQLWKELGIEHVERFESLASAALVYVCDNSSTLYEWAALDRPVVVLNAAKYRRDVDLWPRFWRCADVGVQVDDASQLLDAIALARSDPVDVAERRRAAVAQVFPLQDGHAAQRAADALRSAR